MQWATSRQKVAKYLVHFYPIASHTDCRRFLSHTRDFFGNTFYERLKIASISKEIVLLISVLLKCLISGISENCSYGLPKLFY